MMHTWFEVSIKYQKIAENGMEKKTTEKYLFDSLSFTESEGRCIEEMTPFISGEFTVSDIKGLIIQRCFSLTRNLQIGGLNVN